MTSLTTMTATSALMHRDQPHHAPRPADDDADRAAGPAEPSGAARRTRLIVASVLTVMATSMLLVAAQRTHGNAAAQSATVAISAARAN